MLLRYMPKIPLNRRKFDLIGFALIGLFLASLQMMLDRGQQLDWFESNEIWVEAGVMAAALWMFLVHTLTTDHPLFERSMFADRNFATGLLFMVVTGVLLLAGLALLPPLLQRLYGYSVLQSGMLTMPRGIGTLISMLTVGRISKYVDTRWLVALGMALMGWSLHIMSGFALVQGSGPVIWSGVIQGLGLGMLFVTIQALAFTTLAPVQRTAAASLLNLARNVGGSVGISLVASLLARNLQTAHADMAGSITEQVLPSISSGIVAQLGLPASSAIALVDAEINRQAAFIAYLDDFWIMMWVTFAAIPLVLLLRQTKRPAPGEPAMAMAD
jgi:DHA2 family multidrug resistance protein